MNGSQVPKIGSFLVEGFRFLEETILYLVVFGGNIPYSQTEVFIFTPKTRKRLQNKGLIIVVSGLVETCKGNEATSPLQQKKGQESRTNSCLSFSLQLMLYGMNALHSHCCNSHGLPRGGDRDGRSAHQDHIPDCLRPMPSPRHPRCRSHRHTA